MAQIGFLGAPIFQATDGEGIPIAGGLLWCYEADTDVQKDMYATIDDALDQVSPIANPAVLDGEGRASIVYSGSSKFVLEGNDIDPETGHGSLIWTADNVGTFGNTILDANGNIITDYQGVPDAVNYTTITNASSGERPIFSYDGVDSNVSGMIKLKGSGTLRVQSGLGYYDLPNTAGATGNILYTDGTDEAYWGPPPSVSIVIPPGMVMDFAGTGSAPSGWIACDGSAISRGTYSDLFAAIGITYGSGDGVNTFNVPNLARRVRMGAGGSGTGTIGNAVSNTGGEENHTLILSETPSHNHSISPPVGNYSNNVGAGGTFAGSVGSTFQINTFPTSTGSQGSNGAHNNIQPAMIMQPCIKV